MTGRSIRIYLVDGDASGLLTAEVMNWSGKFVVSPRTMLNELATREEVSCTGAGAAIVNAGNINGRTAWKVSNTKQTYADWHRSQLPEQDHSDGQ